MFWYIFVIHNEIVTDKTYIVEVMSWSSNDSKLFQ